MQSPLRRVSCCDRCSTSCHSQADASGQQHLPEPCKLQRQGLSIICKQAKQAQDQIWLQFVSGEIPPGLNCTSLQNHTQAKLTAMCQAKCLWPASDKAHVCKHASTARQSLSNSSFAHLQILPAFCVRGSVFFRFRQHTCMKAQEHIEAKLKRMLICSPANPRCALCQETYPRQFWTALRSPSRWQP